MRIIFQIVLMLFTKISPWLLIQQVAKVGTFFLRHSVVKTDKN